MQRMADRTAVTVILGGDVMTGCGIDQVLPHPSPPVIYEPYVSDAGTYVRLAEEAHGPIPRRLEPPYLWGDALPVLRELAHAVRFVNLETAVTTSSEHRQGKGINYRMHPENIGVLTPALIDVAALANNHVLDWGCNGLQETISTLERVGIGCAGAGRNSAEAASPAVRELGPNSRVIVFSAAHGSSGVPPSWAAGAGRPGVNLLPDLSDSAADRISEAVRRVKRPGDVVVLSVHWGANWSYEVPAEQVRFSRRLIDAGGIDVVHGHSSHHVKPVEVRRGKLILYGCGDLLNDYEGIPGHERYRADLALLYAASIDSSGRLLTLEMVPLQVRRFRLERPAAADVLWLTELLGREGVRFGTGVVVTPDQRLRLLWKK